MSASHNKNYMPFDDALLFGSRAQDRVADLLRLAGAFCNKVDDRNRYDFETHYNNHVFRVEVKCEDNYASTGNICIETRQGWPLKKSGIAWSEATIIIHTLADNIALYRRREMLEYLRNEVRLGYRFEQEFGDNNNRGFVLSIDELTDYEWFDYCPSSYFPKSSLWTF